MNFVIFWPQILRKYIDSGYLMSATPHTILYQSFWNFAHVFSMFWRCACGLEIIFELIFVTFFHFMNFVIFWPSDSMEVYKQWVPFKCNSIYNFAHVFFHGLKMCMWFGFNPAVNFCHFFTLLTFSVFNFSQVRHQLHRSLIVFEIENVL